MEVIEAEWSSNVWTRTKSFIISKTWISRSRPADASNLWPKRRENYSKMSTQSGFHVKSNTYLPWFCFSTPIGLKISLHFLNQSEVTLIPIKIWSLAHIFPRLAPATRSCFEFWLVQWMVSVLCDWPVSVLLLRASTENLTNNQPPSYFNTRKIWQNFHHIPESVGENSTHNTSDSCASIFAVSSKNIKSYTLKGTFKQR